LISADEQQPVEEAIEAVHVDQPIVLEYQDQIAIDVSIHFQEEQQTNLVPQDNQPNNNQEASKPLIVKSILKNLNFKNLLIVKLSKYWSQYHCFKVLKLDRSMHKKKFLHNIFG